MGIFLERGVGDLLETIAHELAGHLSKYTNVLNAYEKTQKYVDAKESERNHLKPKNIKK